MSVAAITSIASRGFTRRFLSHNARAYCEWIFTLVCVSFVGCDVNHFVEYSMLSDCADIWKLQDMDTLPSCKTSRCVRWCGGSRLQILLSSMRMCCYSSAVTKSLPQLLRRSNVHLFLNSMYIERLASFSSILQTVSCGKFHFSCWCGARRPIFAICRSVFAFCFTRWYCRVLLLFSSSCQRCFVCFSRLCRFHILSV